MKRKIIKQGNGTLTVTLPKKWAVEMGAKGGDEIEIDIQGTNLILSQEPTKEDREISLDMTGLDRSTIILLIQSLYIKGYDTINITNKDTKTVRHLGGEEFRIDYVVRDAMNRLMGMEITSSSLGKYKIQDMTKDSGKKFDVILRRIFLLIIEMFETFSEGARKRDAELIKAIKFQHVNVRRFINYALRLLNKFGYKDYEKTNFYFSGIYFLNKVGEIIKNYAGHIVVEQKEKIVLSAAFLSLFNEIRELFNLFYEHFYKYDINKQAEIQKKRDLFKKKLYKQKLKLNKEDLFMITAFAQIPDLILDLSELRVAIGD